ncbi:MFS transporter [Actinoplanes sp. NPDC023801]|uniref:MFS transporter n=1 Tax=Actinoplanes sp. NPDC023801 TaxID=3154595 RepID=UPI00340E1B58
MGSRMVPLLALAAAAFCYVATETMPIGILTLIAGDLGVSAPAAGLLITGYAVLATVTTLSVAGLYAAFTYTEILLTAVTGFAAAAVAPLLLARGVADFAGIAAGGYASDRWQRGAVTGSVAVLAVSLLAMYATAASRPVTAVLLAVTGFAIGALTPALQNRVMEVAPGGTEMASAGNSVAFNIGIAAGSLLGAAVLQESGARATALAGGLLSAAALLLFLAEPLIARRTPEMIRT